VLINLINLKSNLFKSSSYAFFPSMFGLVKTATNITPFFNSLLGLTSNFYQQFFLPSVARQREEFFLVPTEDFAKDKV
jgi:hypothetical protein